MAIPNVEGISFENRLYFTIEGTDYVSFEGIEIPKELTLQAPDFITLLPSTDTPEPHSHSMQDVVARISAPSELPHQLFLRKILLTNGEEREKIDSSELSPEKRAILGSLGTEYKTLASTERNILPLGPAVVWDNLFWPVLKRHDDFSKAFLCGLKPPIKLLTDVAFLFGLEPNAKLLTNVKFEDAHLGGKEYQTLSIAVPSRAVGRADGDLNGLRFAVDARFHLNGLQTSLSYPAVFKLREQPSSSTAPLVQHLLDQGANLLGVTKVSSFIGKEEPVEAAYYQAPFNPRHDGLLSAGVGPSGSASAAASYEWLDFTVGIDTLGGGQKCALVNGLFQYRPTHNYMDTTGFFTTYKPWNTPCMFARDLDVLERVASSCVAQHQDQEEPAYKKTLYMRPKRLIVPQDFSVEEPEEKAMIESFILDVEKVFERKRIKAPLAQLWKESKKHENLSVEEYLADVAGEPFYRDVYRATEDYRAQCREGGDKRFCFDTFTYGYGTIGSRVSDERYNEGTMRLEFFKKWLLDDQMKSQTFESYWILPIATARADYRNELPGTFKLLNLWDHLLFPSLMGAPSVVVPIGEVYQWSSITLQMEWLPVCCTIVGAPGSDLEIFELLKDVLKQSNRRTKVAVGSQMFRSDLAMPVPGAEEQEVEEEDTEEASEE